MTKELELLKELKAVILEQKKELERSIDEMAHEYAKTEVDLLFGKIEEDSIPEAKVKSVGLIITGSIANATLESVKENLEGLDRAIKELEEEAETEEAVEETEEVSEEELAKAFAELMEALMGAIEEEDNKYEKGREVQLPFLIF